MLLPQNISNKIKRHGSVSRQVYYIARRDRVYLREPASCERLQLPDLNNG